MAIRSLFATLAILATVAACDSNDEFFGPPGMPGPDACYEFLPQMVFFDSGQASLRPDAMQGLAPLLAGWIADDATLKLTGHTDAAGSATANMALSRARAEAVKRHFVAKGISAARIEVSGLGEAKPLAPTPPGQKEAQNRRVEISVLKRERFSCHAEVGKRYVDWYARVCEPEPRADQAQNCRTLWFFVMAARKAGR